MKQQTHDKLNIWRTRKKSEPQMGFEPTTLRDQFCLNFGAIFGHLMLKI